MKSPLTSHYKPTSTSAPILSLFPLLVLEKSSLLLSKTSPSIYAPDPIPSHTLVNIAHWLPPLFPTPLINLSPWSAISLKTNSGLFHLLTHLPSPNTHTLPPTRLGRNLSTVCFYWTGGLSSYHPGLSPPHPSQIHHCLPHWQVFPWGSRALSWKQPATWKTGVCEQLRQQIYLPGLATHLTITPLYHVSLHCPLLVSA